ncbi:L-threonylcarbamoyladenylate synthase [Legionella micdadei]|uniref:Threonylcarbamoyl-AMP synthase n=1 Tax=Legionella micdadei TaxID=451 RepID=A0A098GDP2_LEGMI|nr:L-threonylcarbamoyladenylate synthase [Legionella micdadei]ARG98210.1 threonylcarbamoyl-AMP synthase [Legionella micdadei]KTD29988.1 translation initiation protein [Legionella micdadei]NSL18954.1 threonylcarbamoyl-AMP synthase [Legionella micdadei]CEG60130.1 Sua5/YciO/YrdC/YwlC family protein [Legionella micdadei]SCY64949.1 L-threonylcarbamoyladenylate synthase [Legionella micdadei]
MSTITTDIELVASHLKQGNVVAIPTETVYGLAGNAEDEHAIKKIYTIKNRPLNHPLIMHVAEGWDLSRWVAYIPDYARSLMKQFWPGPLTLVMQAKPGCVSQLVTGGQDTVAIRCPKHPITQALLQRLNFPLVAPSANPFGKISPTTAEHVQDSFRQEDFLILDGGRCQVGIESTIVAATNPEGYEILRHGSINEVQINAILPEKQLKKTSTIRAPGRLASHYQPEKPLYCFPDSEAIKRFCQESKSAVYVLSFAPKTEVDSLFYYQLPNSPEQVAFELYYQLRQADQSEADFIAIELPPEQGEWLAIRERILKAGYR